MSDHTFVVGIVGDADPNVHTQRVDRIVRQIMDNPFVTDVLEFEEPDTFVHFSEDELVNLRHAIITHVQYYHSCNYCGVEVPVTAEDHKADCIIHKLG
jgi:hypothetical protein